MNDNTAYFEDYIQCLIDAQYYQYRVQVQICNDTIILSNLPANELTAQAICTFVQNQTGLEVIREEICEDPLPCSPFYEEVYCYEVENIWFPLNNLLFLPLVADPRQVATSVGYRLNDRPISKYVIAVSVGDIFPVYRWRNIWRWHGDLQFDVEAGIWSIFDTNEGSFPLMNSDFHVGFAFSYAVKKWVFRLRFAHQSSHLGDECLLYYPDIDRKNPSRNSLDFFVSHQASESLRLYAGIGCATNDSSYRRESTYAEGGFEVRVLGAYDCFLCLWGTPYLAAHFRMWRDPSLKEWDHNSTYALGYEWSKHKGIGRKIRCYMLYHDGFSVDGQFSRERTNYLGFGIAYGY